MTSKSYNKSSIMREAHYMRKVLGISMSDALKMTWNNAKTVIARRIESLKKEKEYQALKARQKINTKVADMSYLANSLHSFYQSRAYQAD